MIVQRKLAVDDDGVLTSAPSEIDVEVRNIWQPWLRSRCDFAVRYIVPSRVNLIKILEAKKRFSHEVEIDDSEDGEKKIWSKMTFRPRLVGRLMGKRDSIVWRELDFGKAGNTGTNSVSKKSAFSSKSQPNPMAIFNEGKAKIMQLLKK